MLITSGRYVKIHGLQSEKAKKHNGKTAIVKTPVNVESGRCGVLPIGDEGTKLLAIKPSNLSIMCSYCKMKEEQTLPGPLVCERCQQESYCSQLCKQKHWEGANPDNEVPNSHKIWCIPINLEMEAPTAPVGSSNVGEDVFEHTARYLQLAADIGNSGRKNEERVMLEKLLEVDTRQPSAMHNLFLSCSELARVAERYHPEDYDEMQYKAVGYLTMGSDMVGANAKGGSLEGQLDILIKVMIETINDLGLQFLEECMRNERGKDNRKLELIRTCLEKILKLFEQTDESPYLIHSFLGLCNQKLQQYVLAVHHFEQCCETSLDHRETYRAAFVQKALCLSFVAMYYEEEDDPNARVGMMNGSVAEFNKAIEMLKKEDPAAVYSCQAKFARTLFNQNSMLNTLAQQQQVDYPQEKKDKIFATFSGTVDAALHGAVEAGDESEIKALQSMQELPFT